MSSESLAKLALVIAAASLVVGLLGTFTVAVAAKENCGRIELGYQRIRDTAIRQHREFRLAVKHGDKDYLGLPLTAKLKRIEKRNFKRTLEVYGKQSCTVLFWTE